MSGVPTLCQEMEFTSSFSSYASCSSNKRANIPLTPNVLFPPILKQADQTVLPPPSQPLIRFVPQLLLRLGYRAATVPYAGVDSVPELECLLQVA